MAMALHLSSPPDLEPVVPFTDSVPDARWGRENSRMFALALHRFYRDTNFHRFFADHKALYDLAISRFEVVLNRLDLNWYRKFYGAMPASHFGVILGVNNGGGNYGRKVIFPDGHEELFAIIGVVTTDVAGRPRFGSEVDYLGLIIHEFNHSFVNSAVHEKLATSDSVLAVFKAVSTQMQKMEYDTPEAMVNESLVRAAVILYFRSHGSDAVEVRRRMLEEQAQGFVWMDELCDLLGKYEADRVKYPSFASFLAVVAKYYESLAPRIDKKIRDFNEGRGGRRASQFCDSVRG